MLLLPLLMLLMMMLLILLQGCGPVREIKIYGTIQWKHPKPKRAKLLKPCASYWPKPCSSCAVSTCPWIFNSRSETAIKSGILDRLPSSFHSNMKPSPVSGCCFTYLWLFFSFSHSSLIRNFISRLSCFCLPLCHLSQWALSCDTKPPYCHFLYHNSWGWLQFFLAFWQFSCLLAEVTDLN